MTLSASTRCSLPDFLPEAAQLTREWAPKLCTPSTVRHEGCADYHAAWSTLRLIGAITGAKTDKDFFHTQFTSLARIKPNAQVLIAGTADHAMLHMVLEAFAAVNAQPDVTVVDRCATTLRLNQWYAQQVGARVACVQADLREINLPNRFDLITTHSLFSFMGPHDVPSALQAWRNHLADEGRLILVQGMRPELEGSSPVVFSPKEQEDFVARAQACWMAHGPFDQLDRETVHRLSSHFAWHKRFHAVTDAQPVLEAVQASGLTVSHCTRVERDRLDYRSSAPKAHERAISLRVVAVSENGGL